MKILHLDSIPLEPISHDPKLTKQVFAGDGVLNGIRNVSHMVLRPGSTVGIHSHDLGSEVFYCVRGRLRAEVAGREVELKGGSFLIVEPYEKHAFTRIDEETELFYFFVNTP